MRFLRQSMIGLFLASVTLGLLVWAAQMIAGALEVRFADAPSGPPARERVFAVSLIKAESETITPVLRAFGEISARRTLELRAATGGRIIELSDSFEDGGTVSAGDVLLRIDPADAEAEVARLSADLADAQAETREAARSLTLAQDDQRAAEEQAGLRERAFARLTDLAERGVGSAAATETAELAAAAARAVVISRRQSVTQAEARVDLSATRLSRAQIALEDARRKLADTTVTAPFSGTLSETAVVAGGLVSEGERLADLVDPDDLEVAFRISTAHYARLLGPSGDLFRAPVTVSLDVTGVDLTATGRISRVSAGPGEGQTGRLLFARLGRAPGFRPGDFATVEIAEQPLEDVIRLPATALDSAGELLVVSEDNRLAVFPVEVLRRQGDDVLVRAPGLTGQDVVRGRTPLLGPGVSVRRQQVQTGRDDQASLGSPAAGSAPG